MIPLKPKPRSVWFAQTPLNIINGIGLISQRWFSVLYFNKVSLFIIKKMEACNFQGKVRILRLEYSVIM